MPNEYYDHTSVPAQGSLGASSLMRAEFDAIEAGFDKLLALSTAANQVKFVNTAGTAEDGSANFKFTKATNILTLNGTLAGTGLIINNPTINTPTINTPTINTPAITGGTMASPTISGVVGGNATYNTVTLSTPTITTPAITGGTLTSSTLVGAIVTSLSAPLAVAQGGTGSATAAAARTALGAAAANAASITGGLTVVDSGLTVTAGGLTVTAGGMTVNGGNLHLASGSKITMGGSAVLAGGTQTVTGNMVINSASGAFAQQAFFASGAVRGDFCVVSITDADNQDIMLFACVDSTNSITVTAFNPTTGTVNLGTVNIAIRTLVRV